MSYLAGSRITAGGENAALPKWAFKPASTSIASSTTVVADPDLIVPIAASELGTFAIEAFLNLTGALVGSNDIKLGFSYSGGVTNGVWMGQGGDTTAITNYRGMGRGIDTLTQAFGGNGANFAAVTIKGLIQPSSAGTLSLLWAQNTSSATATVLRLGSWLKLTRMDI